MFNFFGDLGIPLDRVTYRNGQLLAARDANDDRKKDSYLRWMHQRFLHQSWGIALGLGVRKVNDNQRVTVSSGSALDHSGRELLVPEGMVIPLPSNPRSNLLVLALRYQDDGNYRPRTELHHVCLNTGFDPLHDRAIIEWIEPDLLEMGFHVPLIVARLDNVGIDTLDDRVRRYVQPDVRPYIGWGSTEVGRSGWRHFGPSNESIGLEVIVDMSEAGFTQPPVCFAVLERPGNPLLGPLSDMSEILPRVTMFPDGQHFVSEVLRDRFTYRIFRDPDETFFLDIPDSPQEAEEQGFVVYWVGMETLRGCEPPASGIFFHRDGGLVPNFTLGNLG